MMRGAPSVLDGPARRPLHLLGPGRAGPAARRGRGAAGRDVGRPGRWPSVAEAVRRAGRVALVGQGLESAVVTEAPAAFGAALLPSIDPLVQLVLPAPIAAAAAGIVALAHSG